MAILESSIKAMFFVKHKCCSSMRKYDICWYLDDEYIIGTAFCHL